MTKKIYSRDGFFRDRYRCVVDGGARAVVQSCNVLNLAAKLVMISSLISFLILHHPPLLTLDHICGDNGLILLRFIWCSGGAVSPEDGGL